MIVVSEKTYRNVTIAVGVAAVLLLPFWPYSRWGYMPTGLAIALVLGLISMKILSRP